MKNWKAYIPEWLKVRETVTVTVVEVVTVTPRPEFSNSDLWDLAKNVTHHNNWPHFMEWVLRERNRFVKELVVSESEDVANRIKGRIKTLDWLLTLEQFGN